MSRKQKKRLGTVLTVIAVVLIILVLDIGLITNVLTAFKSPFTISSSPPKWIFKPTLDNFRNVLGKGSFVFSFDQERIIGLFIRVGFILGF